jgi:RNA polymerase sigma-70 factor (ECF subfamily)
MRISDGLAAPFLAALPAGRGGAVSDPERLEPLLAEIVASARAAWPDVAIATESFVAYVAARIPDGADPAKALGDAHGLSLYLACGCASGDARALDAFERLYLARVDPWLTRAGASEAVRDEVKQTVRRQLLVAEPGRPPRITDFCGRGDLHGWLRVIAVREALRVMRRQGDDLPLEDVDALARSSDPEIEYLKRHYRAEFRSAFEGAVATLTSRQRNLLRYRFAHRLSADDIGTLYRVHRATSTRWIAQAQRALLGATRRLLCARLRLAPQELESILRLIGSQIDVSIQEALAPADTDSARAP